MKATEATAAQLDEIRQSPDGTRVLFDDGAYVKRGDQLVAESAQPPAPAAQPSTALERWGILPRRVRGGAAEGWTQYGGPEMAGFIAGELAAPWATPWSGMVGGTIGNVAKQVMTRRPKEMSVTEAAMEPTLTAAGAGAAPYVERALKAMAPRALLRSLLGSLEEIPGVRDVFGRVRVSPTLADLTGAKAAGQMENLAGSIPTSSTIVRTAQQAQNEQLAQAFERSMGKLGDVGTRAATGKEAVEGITERFRTMQDTASQMRGNISNAVKAEDAIPTDNLRAEAKRLATTLRNVKYAGIRDDRTIQLLDRISAGYQPATGAAAGTQVEAARAPIQQFLVDDEVSRLVGRGMHPTRSGEKVLQEYLENGHTLDESLAAVNRAVKSSSGNVGAPISADRAAQIAQSVTSAAARAPLSEVPGMGPGSLNLEQWYSTQAQFGSMASDWNLLSTQERGIWKALYKAMQRDLEAWKPANPAIRREVAGFKAFYKNNIVPFNDSLPGRLAAGKINPEDAAARLFTRDGLTELQDVKRWAGGQLFLDLRNRWLAGVFEKVTDPQTGQFAMGNFRRAWNSIDREVKQRAFSAGERRGLDDLAILSERIGKKYTPAGGGSPSGTPLAQVPIFQGGAFMGGATGLGAGIATGNIPMIAGSVAEMLAAYHGPRWLAKMVTTPEGINFLTRAYEIPAASQAGQALLAGIGAVAAPVIGRSPGVPSGQ